MMKVWTLVVFTGLCGAVEAQTPDYSGWRWGRETFDASNAWINCSLDNARRYVAYSTEGSDVLAKAAIEGCPTQESATENAYARIRREDLFHRLKGTLEEGVTAAIVRWRVNAAERKGAGK